MTRTRILCYAVHRYGRWIGVCLCGSERHETFAGRAVAALRDGGAGP